MKTVLILAAALATSPAHALRVALVLDKGGREDKSFNSSAYVGGKRAERELGVTLKVVEAADDNSFEPLLRAFARRHYDLIVAVGVSQADAVQKVARKFPEERFAIVDALVTAPNVESLIFQEQEGSYLVGAIAALKTKTNVIGFIGGMDIPLIRRFEVGYAAGAKKINPRVKILDGFLGVTSEAWNNPPKAKELALSQYKQGADVIFTAAGASSGGIFDAAEEQNAYAIGVDSNQDGVKPGHILTSMLKRVDLAVYGACEDLKAGRFKGGLKRHGLESGAIDFSLDDFNRTLLSGGVLERALALKADIIKGLIAVPDYYERDAHR